MNLKHSYDSLDFFKESLLRRLKEYGALEELRAVPMFTDEPPSGSDVACYERSLGLARGSVVIADVFRHGGRTGYFDIVRQRAHDGDLFLDPDTGIVLSNRKASSKHVRGDEIARLVQAAPGRIIVVYEQSRARGVSEREHAGRLCGGLHQFETHSIVGLFRQVAMVFVSDDATRLSRIGSSLDVLLGPHAASRIVRCCKSLDNR